MRPLIGPIVALLSLALLVFWLVWQERLEAHCTNRPGAVERLFRPVCP